MNIFHRNLILFGFILLLAGCVSSDNDNDTKKDPIQPEETKEIILNKDEKEDVFNKMDTASNEVNIYEVIMKLGIENVVRENKTVSRYELNGKVEESTFNQDLKTSNTSGEKFDKSHVYKLDDKIYVKNNDDRWTETVEQNGEFSNDATFYGNVTAALEKIIDGVELVESGDVYEVRYTGTDQAVFDAFQQPFSLTLPGVDIEKEAEMDVLAVIDKATFYLRDLYFEIVSEQESGNIKMSVEIDYENINDTTIDIPKKVIDEATVDSVEPIEESTRTGLKEADKNNILDVFIETASNVDIYDVLMELVIETIAGTHKESEKAELSGTIDEITFNSNLKTAEIKGPTKNEAQVIRTNDTSYVKSNDENWVKTAESPHEFGEDSTTYSNLTSGVESIRDKVNLFELDDVYEIRYTGSEIEVFNAFEKPFNLWITGADIEKDSVMSLVATIDKHTKLMNDFKFEVLVDFQGTQLNVLTKVEYQNINETTIEVPQAVIDATN